MCSYFYQYLHLNVNNSKDVKYAFLEIVCDLCYKIVAHNLLNTTQLKKHAVQHGINEQTM